MAEYFELLTFKMEMKHRQPSTLSLIKSPLVKDFDSFTISNAIIKLDSRASLSISFSKHPVLHRAFNYNVTHVKLSLCGVTFCSSNMNITNFSIRIFTLYK